MKNMSDEIKKEPNQKKGLSNFVKSVIIAIILLAAVIIVPSIGRNNGSTQAQGGSSILDQIYTIVNQINGKADAIKKDTQEIKEKQKECCGSECNIQAAPTTACAVAKAKPAVTPKKHPTCTNDCTVWNATRDCADGGKQYCGNYYNTDNCLHWSGCIKSGTVKSCLDSVETKCFGNDLKERTIYVKCVGDPYCARDGESGWRTIKNCSPECGCHPRKEETRVIERVVERVIEKETIVNNNVNNNINNNVINVPAPVVETPTVIATPSAPVAAPKVACTQNCPAVEIEKTSPAVIAAVPAAATAPVVGGCTQNCTPKDAETETTGTPVPAPAPVPTPTSAPASGWSPD